MSVSDQVRVFLECLVGRKLIAAEREGFHWLFRFQDVGTLVTECPWRILSSEGIALSSSDDGQKFGLPEVVDAQSRTSHLILGKNVHHVDVRKESGDLRLNFGDGVLFEALNMSSGYEAWQFSRAEGATLICMGGGKLALFDPAAADKTASF